MAVSKQLKLQHLLWRAGFGPEARSWRQWELLDDYAWWPRLRSDSAAPPRFLMWPTAPSAACLWVSASWEK
ncbi:MAG: hypothetical protein IPH12_03545 [Saprospirales bacterium]|nr:hypothetical protein [Saprospirales bacterium]